MANLFDSANAPEGEPTEVVVGDFIQWKRSDLVQDYPPALYSAEYVARINGGSDEIKILGAEFSDYYLFTVNSSDSDIFIPGVYRWQLEITKTSSGDRLTIEVGNFKILPDMDVNASDARIHAEIMVDKIETILSGKADSDVASYSIAGRSLTKMSFSELIEAREYYKREINNHNNKELLKRGKTTSSTIKVRF
jgi:hypothetical protein